MSLRVQFVTSNHHKVKEIQPFFPNWDLRVKPLEIDEIQSLDLETVCRHKAQQAFRQINAPVLVEDTSFELDALNGLPGTFIKFFEQRLGPDALIQMLSGRLERSGRARTCIAYQDEVGVFCGHGQLEGRISREAEPGEGFGFDCCFIPEGYSQVLGVLGMEIKNSISHRRRAIQSLRDALEAKP